MEKLRKQIIIRIECLRKNKDSYKEENNFYKCIWLEGAIFHLENVLIDLSNMNIKGIKND